RGAGDGIFVDADAGAEEARHVVVRGAGAPRGDDDAASAAAAEAREIRCERAHVALARELEEVIEAGHPREDRVGARAEADAFEHRGRHFARRGRRRGEIEVDAIVTTMREEAAALRLE